MLNSKIINIYKQKLIFLNYSTHTKDVYNKYREEMEKRNCILWDNINGSYYIGNRSWCDDKDKAIRMTKKRCKKVAYCLCKNFGYLPSLYTMIHLRT